MRGSVTARHAGVWSDIERWLRRHPVLLQSSVYMSDRITRVVVVVVVSSAATSSRDRAAVTGSCSLFLDSAGRGRKKRISVRCPCVRACPARRGQLFISRSALLERVYKADNKTKAMPSVPASGACRTAGERNPPSVGERENRARETGPFRDYSV